MSSRVIRRVATRIADIMAQVITFAQIIGGIALFAMVVIVTTDVTGRASLNKPLPGAYELTEMLMVVVVFLSFAFCEAKRRHIRVDTLARHLQPRGQHTLDLLAYLIGLFLYVIIGFAAWGYATSAWSVRELSAGAVGIPVYPFKFILMAGCFLLASQFLVHAVESGIHIFRKVGPKS